MQRKIQKNEKAINDNFKKHVEITYKIYII